MEKENWIETILNSTNGITPVLPADDMFSKIQQKIKQRDSVSLKTVWLVAASVLVLVLLNFKALKTTAKHNSNQDSTSYLESTLNQNNQLYQ